LFGLDSGRMPTWMNTRHGYQRHQFQIKIKGKG